MKTRGTIRIQFNGGNLEFDRDEVATVFLVADHGKKGYIIAEMADPNRGVYVFTATDPDGQDLLTWWREKSA